MTTVSSLALALHTDLQNIANYSGNRPLVGALVLTAEEKIAQIMDHLAQVRRDVGMRGSAAIVSAVAEG